ncbi:hypothetical protein ACF3NS_12725 [Arsenicicoccus cauae]|uniref:hypothetical protein n=1 Tax=Arsenicicoccus cauae TaxID=2663847 RepID=UPI00370D165A
MKETRQELHRLQALLDASRSRSAPRISAVDGHFLHRTWTFSTAREWTKAHQIADNDEVAEVDAHWMIGDGFDEVAQGSLACWAP